MEPRGNPGAGRRLDAANQTFMEERFGQDFSDVRIHTDVAAAEAAQALQAEAFTVGRDIYFGAGRYRPQTKRGQRLVAHELTHTVQQRGISGGGAANADVQMSGQVTPAWHSSEREAERIARQVVDGVFPVQAISPGERAYSALRSVNDVAAWPLLHIGSLGKHVRILQNLLNYLGAFPELLPDGIFGPLTESAVKDFQSEHGLVSDGVVGPRTQDALFPSSGSGVTERCRYEPGEDAGVETPGKVEVLYKPREPNWPPDLKPPEKARLYFNFAKGSSSVKSEHDSDLDMLAGISIARYRLYKVRSIKGFTDCVDTETKNVSIRQLRAEKVHRILTQRLNFHLRYATDLKPRDVLPAKGLAAASGEKISTNSTPEGRSRNRSVLVELEETPIVIPPPKKKKPPPPKPPEPQKVLCENADVWTHDWRLRPRRYGVIVGGGGYIQIRFFLTNLTSWCKYEADFYSTHVYGLSLGIGAPLDACSYVDFQTASPEIAKFIGSTKAEFRAMGASVYIGYSDAYFNPAVDNFPKWFDFGGWALEVGLPATLLVATDGRFRVNASCGRESSGQTIPEEKMELINPPIKKGQCHDNC